MSDLSNLSHKHIELTETFIDNFIAQYGRGLVKFISDNDGDTKTRNEIISKIILEIYFRINYDRFDEETDNSVLIDTIAFKLLSEYNRSKGKPAVLKFNLKVLDTEKIELFTNEANLKRSTIDEALKKIGEPGRTLLKLSFHNFAEDHEVTTHIHTDSTNEMNIKRVRFLDRCVELINENG